MVRVLSVENSWPFWPTRAKKHCNCLDDFIKLKNLAKNSNQDGVAGSPGVHALDHVVMEREQD